VIDLHRHLLSGLDDGEENSATVQISNLMHKMRLSMQPEAMLLWTDIGLANCAASQLVLLSEKGAELIPAYTDG
jgi:hypothetical protein